MNITPITTPTDSIKNQSLGSDDINMVNNYKPPNPLFNDEDSVSVGDKSIAFIQVGEETDNEMDHSSSLRSSLNGSREEPSSVLLYDENISEGETSEASSLDLRVGILRESGFFASSTLKPFQGIAVENSPTVSTSQEKNVQKITDHAYDRNKEMVIVQQVLESSKTETSSTEPAIEQNRQTSQTNQTNISVDEQPRKDREKMKASSRFTKLALFIFMFLIHWMLIVILGLALSWWIPKYAVVTDFKADPISLNTLKTSLRPFDDTLTSTDFTVAMNGRVMTDKSRGGFLSPARAVDWSMANGYNVVIVSDFYTVAGGIESAAYATDNGFSILVIPAYSLPTKWGIFTAINVRSEESIGGFCDNKYPRKDGDGCNANEPTHNQIKSFVDRVKQQGGIVSLALFDTSTIGGLTVDTAIDAGITVFEVINHNVMNWPVLQRVKARQVSYLTSSFPTGRRDGKQTASASYPYCWTVMTPAAPISITTILETISNKATSFLYDGMGTMAGTLSPHQSGKVTKSRTIGFQIFSPLIYVGKWLNAFSNSTEYEQEIYGVSVAMLFVWFPLIALFARFSFNLLYKKLSSKLLL